MEAEETVEEGVAEAEMVVEGVEAVEAGGGLRTKTQASTFEMKRHFRRCEVDSCIASAKRASDLLETDSQEGRYII